MNQQQFRTWINQIYRTEDQEIDCDQLQAILPEFVDAEVDAVSPELALSEIQQHLNQCPDCSDVMEGLYQAVSMHESGALPTLADLLAELEPEGDRPYAKGAPVMEETRIEMLEAGDDQPAEEMLTLG